MTWRTLLMVVMGALAVVVATEAGLRAVEEDLPVLSPWPSVETEIKTGQLNALQEVPPVLIVGSSAMEAAVDPELLQAMGAGVGAYNAAFPFFTPAATEIWLEEFVKPWGDVELLLIGLSVWPPAEVTRDGLAEGLRNLATAREQATPLEGLALWRTRGLLGDLEEAVQRENAVANGLWTDRGHQTAYYDRAGRSIAGRFPEYGTPTMPALQERALRRVIERARASGATPVIVLEPGRFPDPVSEDLITAYRGWVEAFSRRLHVELWDTYSMGWHDTLFADETHFNRAGTVAYTQYLGALIKAMGESS